MFSRPAGAPFAAGTIAGVGPLRCEECGFPIVLSALDAVPRCPGCGCDRFERGSLFDQPTDYDLTERPEPATPDWLEEVRKELQEGHFLAFDDAGDVVRTPLREGWTRIGRSIVADLRLDDPTVSRRHALIVKRPGGEVRALDDRSLNGVFVNGESVEWAPLSDGDELMVGRYRLYFLDTVGATSHAGSLDAALS